MTHLQSSLAEKLIDYAISDTTTESIQTSTTNVRQCFCLLYTGKINYTELKFRQVFQNYKREQIIILFFSFSNLCSARISTKRAKQAVCIHHILCLCSDECMSLNACYFHSTHRNATWTSPFTATRVRKMEAQQLPCSVPQVKK